MTTKKGSPASIVDQVRTSINEEIVTRKHVAKILKEIKKTRKGTKYLKGYIARFSVDPAILERNRISGSPHTYLEEFVMNALMNQSIKDEGLTTEKIESINSDVDAIHLVKTVNKNYRNRKVKFYSIKTNRRQFRSKSKFTKSKYAQLRFDLRLIDAAWKQFELNRKINPNFKRESRLKSHAKKFFRGHIRYSPIPARIETIKISY